MGTDSANRNLRTTFDSAARLYDRARPRYPDDLFDALIRHTGLQPGDCVLEIGSGTGIATAPLAARGLDVTCVELGERIVEVAQELLAGYPNVQVVHADFDEWQPAAGSTFDAVVAATSWHWVEPSAGYPKVAALLRAGGHFAVWTATHVFPTGGDDFFVQLQEVYDEIGERLPPGAARSTPDELAPAGVEAASGGLFVTTETDWFDWELVYDADSYIELLDTFSGHIAMEPWQRARLDGEIRRRLARRPDGRVRRHWGAVLEISQLAAPAS